MIYECYHQGITLMAFLDKIYIGFSLINISMRKHLKKIRKSIITKEELIADAIFLGISAFISFAIVLLFDIHHSFYDWPMEFKTIFQTRYPYYIFIPVGAIIGLFILKLILFGFKEEEKKKR
jgi:hypothetical protein